MKKKILIILTSVVLMFTFTLPSFAEDFTFKALIDPGDSDSDLTAYRQDGDGNKVYVEYWWRNDESLVFPRVSGATNNVTIAAGANAISSAIRSDVSANNVALIWGNFDVYSDVVFNTTEEARLSVWLYLYDGTATVQVPMSTEFLDISLKSWGGLNYDFSFYYDIPGRYTRLVGFEMVFTFPGVSAAQSIVVESRSDTRQLSFYCGSSSDAPLYPGSDSSSIDNATGAEEELKNKSQSGIDEGFAYINSFESLLLDQGAIYSGLFFMSSLINDFVGKLPWLSHLLTFSLALGVLLVVLGVVDTVLKRSKD